MVQPPRHGHAGADRAAGSRAAFGTTLRAGQPFGLNATLHKTSLVQVPASPFRAAQADEGQHLLLTAPVPLLLKHCICNCGNELLLCYKPQNSLIYHF